MNGFQKTGLYPFDHEIADTEQLYQTDGYAVQPLRTGLRFLEQCIGYEKLQMFESAYGGEWLGDAEDNSLFMLWSNVKDDIGSFHLTHPGPLSAVESLPDKNLSDENRPSKECPSADLHSNEVSCSDVAGPSLTVAALDNTLSELADTVPLTPHAANTSPTDPDATTPIALSESSTSEFSALKSIQSKQPAAVSPSCFMVERLRIFSMPAKQTGKKRKRSLSSSVYALTSKIWRELCEAEEQEKSQKGKKKGKIKKRKGKVEGGKQGGGKGKEKQKYVGDWKCRACNSSFSQDEENGKECKWIQCDKCKEASHIDCIPDLHRMLFTFDTNKEMSICVLPAGIWKVK